MRTSAYVVDVLVDKTPTTFTIPKNSRIDSIVVEKKGTAAGNISIGNAVGPTYETILLDNITGSTGAGILSISLRGGATTEIVITRGMTGAQVASAIALGEYEGYSAALQGVDGVLFTSNVSGVKTGSNVIVYGNTGIVTGEPTVTREGADLVPAVTEEATLTVTAGPSVAGTITVAGEDIEVDPVTQTDAVTTATAIAEHTFTSWNVLQGVETGVDDHIVYFTAKVAGIIADVTFADTDTTSTAATVDIVHQGADEIAAVAEQVTLPAPGDPTSDGYVTITLDEIYAIHVTAEEDAASVKAAILAVEYDGWTTADVGGDIVFTASVPGVVEVTPDVSYGTEITSDAFAVTPGTGWVVGEQVVATTALSTVHNNLSTLTLVKDVFVKDQSVVLSAGITDGAVAILHIMLERFI